MKDELTSESICPYGKYKMFLTKLINVPAEYLLEIYNLKGGIPRNLKSYIKKNRNELKERANQEVPFVDEPVLFKCEKRTYANQKLAKIALNRILSIDDDNKKPIRTYECPKCNGWHLTSLDYDTYKLEQKAKA